MEIHLLAEDVDGTVTVGGEGAEVSLDEALGQIPPRAVEDLMPAICATANPVVREVMMYHAALAYIDDKSLWQSPRITFSVELSDCSWSFSEE
ncbi:MAG: hypothetical protein ACM31L_19620 [Actinomycetota bacterium]